MHALVDWRSKLEQRVKPHRRRPAQRPPTDRPADRTARQPAQRQRRVPHLLGPRGRAPRALHHSTSHLNVSTSRGMRWVVSVTETAQVEIRSRGVSAPASNTPPA